LSILTLLIGLLVAVAIDTAWVALFRAAPIGRFQVTRNGAAIFRFESDVGSFSILPLEGKLHHQTAQGSGTLLKSDIKGLEFRVEESTAVLQDILLGFDLTDLLTRYADTVNWFSVHVVTHDGQRIPLFLSGEYVPREFLLGWYIDLQTALLQRLGVLKDVEAQSRTAMDTIRAKLGNPPLL
jgi:hypothetical protein